jgi:hypothetical protein
VLVPFVGYSLGRRLVGYVECEGERLTDVLNRSAMIRVRDCFVEDFAYDTVSNLGDGEIERSALFAVEAGAGRGDESRRIRTIGHRLQVQFGQYTALGLLHALPGQMPLPNLYVRGPMIPLSDATIGYSGRGTTVLRDVGTLIVNRDLLDWVRASDDEARAFPGVPVLSNGR